MDLRRAALLLCCSAVGNAACSDPRPETVAAESVQGLAPAAEVLGFEALADWQASSGQLMLSRTHVQGAHALAARGFTWTRLTSAALATLPNFGAEVAFELRLPAQQPNPWYYGNVELHLSAPSLGIYDQFVGAQQLLPPFALGKFQTVRFAVPDGIRAKLTGTQYADLRFAILLSLPQGYGGALLDDLRFSGGAPAAVTWPNADSRASSDPWLVQNHARIQKLEPRVLVLNFDDTRDNATIRGLVDQVIAGLREGSRPRGYLDAAAAPQLDFQVAKYVDLRDPVVPPGWTKRTSSLYPRRPDPNGFNWGTDYKRFFDADFAARFGFANPDQPGQFLTLCQLADRGLVHDVWMVFDPDDGDVSAAEILEWAPLYDGARHRTGDWTPCAGNGCFDADVPHCGGSLRIGFINSNRGPGCFIHGHGHGMEHKFSEGAVLPGVAADFRAFADMDLDTKYQLPISSWYALPADNPDPPQPDSPCDYIRWTSMTSIEWTAVPKPPVCIEQVPRTPLNPYVPVCGSVHFPPNARRHYDDFNTFAVLSTCEGWRRGEGPGGADLARPFDHETFARYDAIAPDCEGGFNLWWRQNMPAYGNPLRDGGQPMLSWWPYLYY